MRRFLFAFAALLTSALAAPLAATAAADALASVPAGGGPGLGLLLGFGLTVGATITGAVRIGRTVYGSGQWEAFLRAARESELPARELQRLAEAGAVDLDGDDAGELLAGGEESDPENSEPLAGVRFTQASVREKAVEKGLTAESFEDYEMSSDKGYTSDDVDTAAEAEETDE